MLCLFLQANLLSSHRSLVHRVETIALGDQPCDRGENVTLFLFNDCLEVRTQNTVAPFYLSYCGLNRMFTFIFLLFVD